MKYIHNRKIIIRTRRQRKSFTGRRPVVMWRGVFGLGVLGMLRAFIRGWRWRYEWHTLECRQLVKAINKARKLYAKDYPNHCTTCEGSGLYYINTLNPWDDDWDFCPQCLDNQLCPQCGASLSSVWVDRYELGIGTLYRWPYMYLQICRFVR